jgi:nicotinamide N-methyltransferase
MMRTGESGMTADSTQEPESPLPAPYSFATFDVPAGVDLDLGEGRTHILTRLVGAHPLWGHYLWNTAKVLSTYLLRHTGLIQGNSVLELGAGAGLPSIIAALAGAQRVVVTDYPDASLVENLRYNVDMNVPEDRRGRIREAVSKGVVSRMPLPDTGPRVIFGDTTWRLY